MANIRAFEFQLLNSSFNHIVTEKISFLYAEYLFFIKKLAPQVNKDELINLPFTIVPN